MGLFDVCVNAQRMSIPRLILQSLLMIQVAGGVIQFDKPIPWNRSPSPVILMSMTVDLQNQALITNICSQMSTTESYHKQYTHRDSVYISISIILDSWNTT
jgi:hypothetical protein